MLRTVLLVAANRFVPTTQCEYCLDVHTRRAFGAGATREEIAEVTFIAAALRAGAAAAHGLLALRLYDEHARAPADAAVDGRPGSGA